MTGPGAERGWHFLVGDGEPIAELCSRRSASATSYNPQTEALRPCRGHRGPDARRPGRALLLRDRLSSQGASRTSSSERRPGGSARRIGRLLLLCYDYDAATGKYTLSIVRLIRVLGTVDRAFRWAPSSS